MKKIFIFLFVLISVFASAQNTHIPTGVFVKDSLRTNYYNSPIFTPWNTFRVKTISLSGISAMNAIGDSYMGAFNGYAQYPAQGDAAIIAQTSGLTLTTYAVGGTGAFQAAKNANANINPASNNQFTYVRFGFNDYKYAGISVSANKEVASCLASVIACNATDSVYYGNDAHIVKGGSGGGSWATFTPNTSGGKGNNTWGGLGEFSHTSGDSLTTYVNGDKVLIGYINQTTSGFTGGNFNYYVNDSLAGNQVCDAAYGITDANGNSNLVAPGVLLIKGLGSGTHKITIKLTTSTYTYIDFIATVKPTENIAPTLVSLIPHILAAGYAVSPSNGSNAAFDQGDSTILATCYNWEWANVTVCFPMDYFNPNTDLSGDNVHPLIPQGYQHLAYAAMAKISKNNAGILGTFQYGIGKSYLKANITAGTTGGFPAIGFYNPSGTTNGKIADYYLDNSGVFHFDIINDANTNRFSWFKEQSNTSALTPHIVTLFADSFLVSHNTNTANTWDFLNNTGRIRLNSTIQYGPSPIVPTTGYAAGPGNGYIRLVPISSNQIFTFPTPAREGDLLEILDSNTNASFNWTTNTTPVRDPAGNSITTFDNLTYYRFIFDGVAWREQFQYSSATTGGSNIYNSNGTLTANRTLSAGGFNLSLGASGDKLSALTVNSSAGISLQGQVQYGIYQPGDANITVPNNVSVVELPIITANRTITLPTMVAGSIIHFFNTNTSNANSWSFTNTVVDANGLYNISTIRSGRSVDVLYDGTIFIAKDPAIGYPSQTLFTQTSTVTVANSSATTSLVGTGEGSMTVPANFFSPGKTIRIKIAGVYGLLTATPGNLVVNLKIGSTTIATGTISNFITTAPTNQGFNIVATVTCRVAGSSGTVMTDGIMTYENNSTSLSPRSDIDLNNAGATTTVNTTTSNLIDCTIAWQTANSANTISATVVSLEVLN